MKIFISSVGKRVVIKLYLLRLEVIPTVDELKLSLIISFHFILVSGFQLQLFVVPI